MPPYSYVPGVFPHPMRDEAGHSYRRTEPKCAIENADAWRACEPYLWGIDLFNAGYYWEAHESWEAVWHAAARKGTIADFCKGLIKLAAAGVKAREGNADGVRRHAARARQLFQSVATADAVRRRHFMGLRPVALAEHADRLREGSTAVLDTSGEAVRIVMPFRLIVGD